MSPRSLSGCLYILVGAIMIQACIVMGGAYLRHMVKSAEELTHTITGIEKRFIQAVSMEKNVMGKTGSDISWKGRYRHLILMIENSGLNMDSALVEHRMELYEERLALEEEQAELHRYLDALMPSLSGSVRYIHEHHIAYLKNLITRGKVIQDYDIGEEFERNPVKSASELDIIKSAVSIQAAMLDIFQLFLRLKQDSSTTPISTEFKTLVDDFYRAVNTFEDYSLDAQDGLLIEELILNGRTFEESFIRFLAMEKSIRELSGAMNENRREFIARLGVNRKSMEEHYSRLEQRIDLLQLFLFICNGLLIIALFICGRKIVRAFRRTVRETESIQRDLGYRISTDRSDLREFGVIFSALNSMADTIKGKVQEVEEARTLLEERVCVRTAELLEVNRKLRSEIQGRIQSQNRRQELERKLRRSQKMEAIGMLAGGVAHDLNNILSGIISYPELMLLDMTENDPLRERLKRIKSSGEKAALIVQDLLTLARRGVSVQDPVDLNDVVESFLGSPECAEILLRHPKVIVKSSLCLKLGPIIGSAVHLSKTLMNLFSNAAEAMPDGGIITISTEKRYVDTQASDYAPVKQGEYAVLAVSDGGIGIAEEDLDRIFEPFFTSKEMGRSGSGLGMAVVWGTVKDHDGDINVESRPGKGTIFTLHFPINREIKLNSAGDVCPEFLRGKGETVLVVDDVGEQRDIAQAMLSHLGYTPSVVSSGETAVEQARMSKPDLLLLDMVMEPGIDGLETYRRIVELHPGQKAVIASGFSESKQVIEARNLGAGAYLKKPYSLAAMGKVIRDELDRS